MILDTIAESTRARVAGCKKQHPLEHLRRQAEELGADTGFPFFKALSGSDIAFICEVKKASPSKGIIAEHFPYLDIAREYEDAGAAAVSVLTEPEFFMGSDSYLKDIAAAVKIPVLRKDFTVDAYQIYEARLLGAAAVLLIAALLPEPVIRDYLAICRSLGLSALVEAHDEKEVEAALKAGAGIIGVNNRDLRTFKVDITASYRLRALVPENRLFVSESGIASPEDINSLRQNGVNAVLIGEALMRCQDKKAALAQLRGSAVS